MYFHLLPVFLRDPSCLSGTNNWPHLMWLRKAESQSSFKVKEKQHKKMRRLYNKSQKKGNVHKVTTWGFGHLGNYCIWSALEATYFFVARFCCQVLAHGLWKVRTMSVERATSDIIRILKTKAHCFQWKLFRINSDYDPVEQISVSYARGLINQLID